MHARALVGLIDALRLFTVQHELGLGSRDAFNVLDANQLCMHAQIDHVYIYIYICVSSLSWYYGFIDQDWTQQVYRSEVKD